MKVNVTVERQITITMTQEECEWLHHVMQNPLHNEETHSEEEIRKKFFDATTLPTDL